MRFLYDIMEHPQFEIEQKVYVFHGDYGNDETSTIYDRRWNPEGIVRAGYDDESFGRWEYRIEIMKRDCAYAHTNPWIPECDLGY